MNAIRISRPPVTAVERAAVAEAASIVRAEHPGTSLPGVASIIVERVLALIVAEIDRVEDDPFAAALAAYERRLIPSPFRTLATAPEIDMQAMFADRWLSAIHVFGGAMISIPEQVRLRAELLQGFGRSLNRRYLGILRSGVSRGGAVATVPDTIVEYVG